MAEPMISELKRQALRPQFGARLERWAEELNSFSTQVLLEAGSLEEDDNRA